MELSELRINEFCELLASDAPAPGGGAAAALTGALGSCLTSMVCALTKGKAKYEEFQALAGQTGDASKACRDSFFALTEQDAREFRKLGSALALPKATDCEKAERTAAVQAALASCTETPLAMMKLSAQALELTEAVVGKSNKNAVSDLGVSAVLLGAAAKSAWLNVVINIGMLKDRQAAEQYRSEGEALLAEILDRSGRIYETVLNML